MPIDNLGKGAIPSPFDPRDYKIEALGAVAPVDFSIPFLLPDPGNEDQNGSSSCVAQAFSYYHNQINSANYSRRDLYARIFLPGGGAYLRDGADQIVRKGQATRDEVLDPSPQTETAMRDKTGVNDQAESSNKELAYYSLSGDMNSIASSIVNYRGAVFGLFGSNPGWQDMENPRPPVSGETRWGHALYAMGYHLHNNVKCIIAKSSWCNEVKQHHIKANYFESGNTFDDFTLAPKVQPMTNSLLLKHGDEYGFYDPATSADGLITLMRIRGLTPPLNPDGTLNFAEVDKLIQGSF